jgi:hypothetical protein
MLIHLGYHFIPKLKGLQSCWEHSTISPGTVVHRAEFWSHCLERRQPPVEHNHPDGVAIQVWFDE